MGKMDGCVAFTSLDPFFGYAVERSCGDTQGGHDSCTILVQVDWFSWPCTYCGWHAAKPFQGVCLVAQNIRTAAQGSCAPLQQFF
jgi:hypothetical protein